MVPFYNRILQKGLKEDVLSGLNFSVFGCGDRKYKYFNAAARRLYQRLGQLGGQVWVDRGLGDD
jgi:sulfite reductase alpha subunit-like flavoprotein